MRRWLIVLSRKVKREGLVLKLVKLWWCAGASARADVKPDLIAVFANDH